MRSSTLHHTSEQTLRLSYITHRQHRYLIFIISYWRWKPNQDERLFPFRKLFPHFTSIYFTATRADPLYSQPIIKLETVNPLISQVTSTFNFPNAANPGNKEEHGSSPQPETHTRRLKLQQERVRNRRQVQDSWLVAHSHLPTKPHAHGFESTNLLCALFLLSCISWPYYSCS